MNWFPTTSMSALAQRAQIMAQIRQFFAERDVLEVDTPAMSQASITDVNLFPFTSQYVGPGAAVGETLYLQTSPEFHMKRLLAAGAGPIYQICKAFRNEESGRFHNPEFTMLEWYRPGFDDLELMDEVEQLLRLVLHCDVATRLTYQQVFEQCLQFDPLAADLAELKQVASEQGFSEIAANENSRDTLLQLLFCMVIEPQIGQDEPCFIYQFPASQAALARLHEPDNRVAERFEVYYKGIELANGFHELTDAKEQLARFKGDNALRRITGKPEMPIDYLLLAGLEHGLPPCAGVAMGVDRLIMLALGAEHIEQVIAFPVERA
ncbi:elongation factor P--(R)-beta-lysine ligase [Motilimonas sp. E26]|uniref:elongation factor P--(R)-beta-lysine ligase n=1 Tax=Motilimonas sp. E26 TaxID=2865674 RepID=UPI001E2FAD2D|nr:elongation factor P--(R)-beta-lysine ligase [Motilimonas sp. E26]MCE0557044.1 elongation factor P--(R)-beta-lysine ligase [Motilimonas sp. E26]